MTVGIPSVQRPVAETIYLLQTLQSLVNQTSSGEKQEVTVVVLLSDLNQTYNDALVKLLLEQFRNVIDNGFIRIVYPPRTIYPNLDKIRKTFNDGKERLKWRAKQNIDFAYLLLYSHNISQYYIQLEDDVLCASNFVSLIKKNLEKHTRRGPRSWFMLEFSKLGFIGKLFRSYDIPWVSKFLLRSYDSHPGDLLLGKMLDVKGQGKPIHSNESLFQHNGKFSSLKNKLMPSIDSDFKDADNVNLLIMELPKGDNPEARLYSTFEAVSGYPPMAAYDHNSSSVYWAKRVKRNEYFLITLQNPQNFSRIIIATGDVKRKKDSLRDGRLMIAPVNKAVSANMPNKCGPFKRLAEFVDGEIDTKAMGLNVPRNILCLKLVPKTDSKTWVIFRDIVLLF